MNSSIFEVALVPPKPNVFQPQVKHLLVLATGFSIAILGFTLKKITGINGKYYLFLTNRINWLQKGGKLMEKLTLCKEGIEEYIN